jgi:Uma2 family endonuclease
MASPALGEGRITSERYWQLVDEGAIDPDDRVELLDGVIVTMAPQSPAHAACIARISAAFGARLHGRAMVRSQSPLNVSELSVPEPDVALVEPRADYYAQAHPTTALLVVEVAASSLPTDRITKATIYATAGISDYWVVNVRDRWVEVHRSPVTTERRFADVRVVRAGETLAFVAFPGVTLAVDDVLPAAASR